MRAVVVVLLALTSACPSKRPFMWEDTLGHRCDPELEPGTLTGNVECNAEPSALCSGEDSRGSAYRACWDINTLDWDLPKSRIEALLGSNVAALCEWCCTDNTVSIETDRADESCAPLICDPAGQAPPAPFECRPNPDLEALIPGYIYYAETED